MGHRVTRAPSTVEAGSGSLTTKILALVKPGAIMRFIMIVRFEVEAGPQDEEELS